MSSFEKLIKNTQMIRKIIFFILILLWVKAHTQLNRSQVKRGLVPRDETADLTKPKSTNTYFFYAGILTHGRQQQKQQQQQQKK
jgi:hypothetical protein